MVARSDMRSQQVLTSAHLVSSSFCQRPSALVLKPPPVMNLAALWHQQSSVLPQIRSLTSQDLSFRKKAIGTKWVYRNKKDEKGVVVRNKARLVAQVHRQEEWTDYDEVFAYVARIEAKRIFLTFASYMGFIVYQMDVKSAFLYETIDEEVYVTQPLRFVDPKFPNKVYKVVKALYGLHQAPRAWYATLSTFLEKSRYKRGAIDKTLFINVKTASTPIETQKPLVKDQEASDVDVHLYRFQVTPKTSHLQAVKRIFRRLISWQCRKQTIMATSTTEAEYVTVAHYYGQVLWIQNQLLDYRDAYEKKLIQVLKIHTGDNVADLLTKAFDVSSALVLKPPPVMNLAALWHQQSSVLPQIRSLTSQGDMSHHQDIYDNPSLTKKVFANIKRVGTGFSGVITPLFDNILVPAAEEVDKIEKLKDRVHKLEEENKILKEKSFKSVTIHPATPVEDKEESFKKRRMTSDMDEDIKVNLEEAQAKAYNLDLQHSEKVLNMQDIDEEEPAEVEEVLEVVTAAKLIIKIVTTAEPTTTAAQVPKIKEEGNKRQGESLEQEITKKQRMDEEAEELKRQLQIVANDNDDDVYIEATPLASKNFDKEDLEMLWKLVKERFETIDPKNFSDDFLLNILKIMFEMPNIETNV
nr:putative ribonuclease H-like domain-containing protein [Tanacetum cinerariifolium]